MRRWTVAHLLTLAAVSFALYMGTLHNGFVLDDNAQMRQNPFLTSYRYIPKLFATNVWEFLGKSVGNYYRPLQMLVYMGEYYLFGFGHPWVWHLAQVLWHIAVVFAAYYLVRALGDEKLALWAALLFAFHPIHVEVVAWIAALPEMLCALSLLLAMRLYHDARIGVRPVLNHGIATTVFFAGLLSKETALVFPALLVAYEFFYRQKSFQAICAGWRRFVPYLCAVALYLAVRVRVLGAFAPASADYTGRQALLSAPLLLSRYIFKVLLPLKLNYNDEFVPQSALDWKFAGSMALIVALVVATLRLRKARPLMAFAMAWFFLTIAPVLNILNLRKTGLNERYLYLPSFGFCILAGWAWLRAKEGVSRRRMITLAYASLAVVLVLCTVLIVERVPDWRSDVSIYQKAAALYPKSADAQANLGLAYYEAGQLDLATARLDRSLSLDPSSSGAHLYMALALSALGDSQEASAHLNLAEKLNGEPTPAWALFGQVYANMKQWDRAIACYRKEVEVEPQNPVVYTVLGEALQEDGKTQESTAALRQALQLQPGFMDASINLAVILAEEGDTDQAIKILTSALQMHPDAGNADAGWFNLGNIYAHRREWKSAGAAYEHALELNPDLNAARERLESVEAEQAAQRQ